MNHLQEIGTIIYLQASFHNINTRLSNMKGRGVVLREGQTLQELYKERTCLYEKYADIIINEDGLNVEETIEKTLQSLHLLLE